MLLNVSVRKRDGLCGPEPKEDVDHGLRHGEPADDRGRDIRAEVGRNESNQAKGKLSDRDPEVLDWNSDFDDWYIKGGLEDPINARFEASRTEIHIPGIERVIRLQLTVFAVVRHDVVLADNAHMAVDRGAE